MGGSWKLLEKKLCKEIKEGIKESEEGKKEDGIHKNGRKWPMALDSV